MHDQKDDILNNHDSISVVYNRPPDIELCTDSHHNHQFKRVYRRLCMIKHFKPIFMRTDRYNACTWELRLLLANP